MRTLVAIAILILLPAAVLSQTPTRGPGAYDAPMLLAAAPGLGGDFARTVLLALPAGSGMHIGLILNRPTDVRVSAVFPEVPAAREVASPVFAGGPTARQTILALTRSAQPPGENAVKVLPQLFLSIGNAEAARAVARYPQRTRFYTGFVAWESSALQMQIDAGAWQAVDPDLELVIGGSTDTLWERVLDRMRTMLAMR